jgi:hypothetical protein
MAEPVQRSQRGEPHGFRRPPWPASMDDCPADELAAKAIELAAKAIPSILLIDKGFLSWRSGISQCRGTPRRVDSWVAGGSE